ncbi:MAG: GTP-binding protein [Candidatus Heimdallarchaeota archaeon]|nr:MAG: GTP-binding protein [Candidatus Heimdallarchaeota archaeon]
MVTITSKIVICGDFAVGKTTFVKSFLGGEVLEGYKPTIGVDIGKKVFDIEENKLIFQIWDLSGQQSFQAIRYQFYSRTDGAVLIFDISRRKSYQNILSWTEEMLEQTGLIPVVLVGNKIDLRDQTTDHVTTAEGEELSKLITQQTKIQTPFVEASAIQRYNNLTPFISLGKMILQRHES